MIESSPPLRQSLRVRTRSKSPSGQRGPTIHDVARAANVSTATVSNVLRGTRYVGPELQQRVQDAIAALQYSPNSVAASLRERRSRTLKIDRQLRHTFRL